jgi:beta-phosphoglucomutase
MKCILFDFDGVIIDSEIGAFDHFRKSLKRKGINITLDELLKYTGKRSLEITTELFKKNNIAQDPQEFLKENRNYGSYYEVSELQIMPGLIDFLELLSGRSIKTAVVSSTSSRSVVTALNRLSLVKYLDAIICGDMVKSPKPSPEGYLKASKFLNAKPVECIVIEDSPIGIQAGKNAGMKVIGFKGSTHKQDTSTADFEFKSYKELMDFFNKTYI